MIGWLLDIWSRIAHPAAGITYAELESVWRVVAGHVLDEFDFNEVDAAVAVHFFFEKKERFGPVCLSRREFIALKVITQFELMAPASTQPYPTPEQFATARRFLERTGNGYIAQRTS